jgi:membrane protease subunit HflC
MNLRAIGIIVAVLAAVFALSTYTVHETQRAILFSLGEIKAADLEPGLHFKFPFINNVVKFDGRVLGLNANPNRFLTAEKKNVIVDSFVKWRIEDVGRFYRSFRGDQSSAENRLAQIIRDELRNEFGTRTIQEAVSGERSEIMETMRLKADRIIDQYGMRVLDVRISRIELPAEVNESVYNRMRTERQLAAKEFRARGREAAVRVRANADRRRTIILADAYREAQRMRGEGDAKAAGIYARAYGDDREFYNFYRSLNAYTNTFRAKDDLLVIDPKGEFFRYFNEPGGAANPVTPGGASQPARNARLR